ncbi:monovalent cation/H(+) antiporter subunit G [Pontiellaceae bacterium B12227]|nr:monovalent cation/H(+) antiporter subunit G [Pontiellaceae bacterium B12227]
MSILSALSYLLIACGLFFFTAGTVGLLRFPDVFCRLHALTKADNLGLGLIVFGAMLRQSELTVILKLVLIWLLVLIASATTCYLVAESARRNPEVKERRNDDA